ncbi:uncharacterized protein LOC135958143 isoform X2 [Calliphora vicina]|uniref:uncharacterized protein LOC135958143 isoform X2 n=1 Tax=Calliphora vicina TaxID=7373 RepID=UPI00325A61D2
MSVEVLQHFSPAPVRSACETISLASDGSSKCAEIFVTNNADKWTFFCAYCQMATVDIGAFICHIRLEHLNRQTSEIQSKNSTTIAATRANDSNLTGVVATTQNVEAEDEFMADAQQQPPQNEIVIKQEVTSNQENLQSFGSEKENLIDNKLSTIFEENNANFENLYQNTSNLIKLETDNSFSEDQQEIPAESETFEEMVTKFSNVIEPMFIHLTNEVNSLHQEINSLCSEFKELKKDKLEVKLTIPDSPFKIMDEFLKFENLLQEDKLFLKSFEKELRTVAKSPNFTKNCWRKLLTDELAEHLCWKGTTEKKCARSMSAAKAIRNAAISMGVKEEEFVKSTKSFFQFAKTRQESRKKYFEKKLNL